MNQKTIVMCVISLILGILFFYILQSVCGCKNVVEGMEQICVGDPDTVPGTCYEPPSTHRDKAEERKDLGPITQNACVNADPMNSGDPPLTWKAQLCADTDWTEGDAAPSGYLLVDRCVSGEFQTNAADVDVTATPWKSETCATKTPKSCLRPNPSSLNPSTVAWGDCTPDVAGDIMQPGAKCPAIAAGYDCEDYHCKKPKTPSSDQRDKWAGCKKKECAAITVPDSVNFASNGVAGSFGDGPITVACNEGYGPGGPWFCAVNTDGDMAWSTDAAGTTPASQCTPKVCPTVSSVEHSKKYKSTAFTGKTGDIVNVACDKGYGPGGHWVCTADGKKTPKWATAGGATPPECSPSNCAELTPPNSNTQLTGHTGGEAVVECTDGTVVQWKCGINGTFSGPPCPEPGDYLGTGPPEPKGCCNPV